MFKGIAKQYAQTLFDLAKEKTELVSIERDVKFLLDLIKTKEFIHFLETPFVPFFKKEEFLNQVLKDKLIPLTFHFLFLLVEKRRMGLLPLILEEFLELSSSFKGIAKVDVTTSQPLNEHQKHAIVHHLKEKFNKEIEAGWQVNQKILGGFKIQKEDVIFDYSLTRQLEIFEKEAMKV